MKIINEERRGSNDRRARDLDRRHEHQHTRLLGWAFKRELSIGDLVAMVTALIMVIVSWNKMSERVTVLELAKAYQLGRDDTQDKERVELKTDLTVRLERIENKVDEAAKAAAAAAAAARRARD